MADPLSVPCPDCAVPAGVPCATSIDYLDGAHAERQRVADLQALDRGTCALCGRFMVRGSVEGSPVDAWHPDETAAAACPPMPDPRTDWNAYAEAINAGVQAGHPGAEHFRPSPSPAPLDDGTDRTARLTDDDLPGQWSLSDFTGGDPNEQSYAQRVRDSRTVCPECRAGKHPNCDGTAWDVEADGPTVCTCHTLDHPDTTP